MRKKKNRVIAAFLSVVLFLSSLIAQPVYASGVTESELLESIMKGLKTFVYKAYEWPNSLTIGGNVFSIIESLYTVRRSIDQKPVLWNDSSLEREMKQFYAETDWNQFEGMYETVDISSTCEAKLTNEVQAYEELMDVAADNEGFTIYRELFKAIAQARFNVYKKDYEDAKARGDINGTGDDKFDLFHIDGSWIHGGSTPLTENQPYPSVTPVEIPDDGSLDPWPTGGPAQSDSGVSMYTVQESINLAAKAFSQILYEAVFPTPYEVEPLICVVQGFEFGGDSADIKAQFNASSAKLDEHPTFITFTLFCQAQEVKDGEDVDYDSYIEKYAKVIADNKTRSGDQDTYGKYKYSDQYFYEKVFEVYECSGSGGPLDLGKLPEEYKDIIRKCMHTWGSKVNKDRRAIIQNAILLYGVTYSMDKRNCPSVSAPQFLDCSSFVGQSYWRAGLYPQDTAWWTTGTFATYFKEISASELIPGDIAQISWNPGGSGASEHVGIYIGTVEGTKYYIHCTGSKAVTVNNYSGFVRFGRCPKL